MSSLIQSSHDRVVSSIVSDSLSSYVKRGYLTASNNLPISSTQFYTSVSNREPIPDIKNDLKANFGIERFHAQRIYEIQKEASPYGLRVWGLVGDTDGLVRLVGREWKEVRDSAGDRVQTNWIEDYIEITFYGTGLNILTYVNDTRSMLASVDGQTEFNFLPFNSGGSSTGIGRYLTSNTLVSVVSGLSLGIHTVKITNKHAAGWMEFVGYEVVNESSSGYVHVNPGTAYVDGVVTTAKNGLSFLHNQGITGTKGGRQLVYLKQDGSINVASRSVDADAKYLDNTDHSNEEEVRFYHYKEFGSAQVVDSSSSDFGSKWSGDTASSAGFVLNDGTTGMRSSFCKTQVMYGGPEALSLSGTYNFDGDISWNSPDVLRFTFVGTGLDIITGGGSVDYLDPLNVYVDGAYVGVIQGNDNPVRIKLCSGLPYGTHTVTIRIMYVELGYEEPGLGETRLSLKGFVVYQPKKPTVSQPFLELASFNVMASNELNSTSYNADYSVFLERQDAISKGVLRKCSSREAALYGTNWSLAKTYSTAWNGVHEMNTTSPNAYIEHTFFGTGVEIKYVTHPNRATNIPITINGLAAGTSNFPNVQVTSSGGSHTRSSSSLILNQNTAGLPLTAVTSIKGLPLGVHKVRLTHSGTSGSYLAVTAFDCITPVHVHKDVNYVQGASSVVGSCSVSDIRKTDSSKEKSLAYKNWMEFRQTGNFFTTFAGFWVPTGAGGTIRTRQGFVDVRLSGIAFPRPLNHGMYISVKMDGNFVGHYVEVNPYSSNDEPQTIATSFLVPVSEGVHSFRVHINVSSVGSLSNCVLTVKEI